jgi:ferredoxin
MLETVTHDCVGKTIVDVRYTYREDGTCEGMELSFSDGTEMGIGCTSDGSCSLCSVIVPGPFSEPNPYLPTEYRDRIEKLSRRT